MFSPPESPPRPPLTDSARAIFEHVGPWTTRFDIAGETLGGIYNFIHDERIQRLAREVPLAGKRILELGCLEGGHSVALSRYGPEEIVAVEGRVANYVRCCVIKNLFGLDRVRFALDDVRQVTPERYGLFDVLVTMGVLYHLRDPHVLVGNLARLGDVVYLTTAYATSRHPQHSPEAQLETPWGVFRGRRYSEYGLQDPLSGLNEYSIWLYGDDLIEMFRRAGFGTVKVMHQDDNTDTGARPSTIDVLLRK